MAAKSFEMSEYLLISPRQQRDMKSWGRLYFSKKDPSRSGKRRTKPALWFLLTRLRDEIDARDADFPKTVRSLPR